MQPKWKLALLSASALVLMLALVNREGWRGRADVSGPEEELDAPEVVEPPRLEPAPGATTAERRDFAELDSAPGRQDVESTVGPATDAFSVRVTLRELDGAALAPGSAHVSVADEAGEGFGAAPDAEGVALLTDLAPGRWWVRGSAAGRMTETREVDLRSRDAGLELELRLAPRPHVRILVHALDGRPFADTLPQRNPTQPYATASRRRPEGWLGDVLEAPRWDDCGTFIQRPPTESEPALLGRIELDCAPPLWVSLHLNEDVLESQLLESGVEELRFLVDPEAYAARFGELVLRVVDAEDARPVPGAWGQLQTGPRQSHMTRPNSESRVRFPGVMAGRVSLELSATGYETRLLELALQPGERKDLGDVELSRAGAGTLQVSILGGVGASDVKVSWTTDGELRISERSIVTHESAPVEGDMLEVDLARGGWGVWASARRAGVELRSRLQHVAMDGGRVALTLVLEPVATLVLEPVGRPIDVWVQTPEGLLAHGTKLRVDDVPTRIALVPGSYTLLLSEEGREDRVQQLDLPAQGATIAVD